MVEPGMVYISYPTEYGTLYSQKELDDIYSICKEYKLPLYIDGARLGYGLMAEGNDVTAESIAKSCDVFYIGGTKVGALFGEAVVVTNKDICPHFFTYMKQHGGLLAKGRLLGVQFDAMFTDNLYFKMGENAIKMASKLKKILADKGYETYIDSPTNQLFVIGEDSRLNAMKDYVSFDIWGKTDDTHTIVRFATSWATTEDDINELTKYL
jgi:threonine aldolase